MFNRLGGLLWLVAAHRMRPIFVVDASIPGDVDNAVEKLDGAFVYDLNDLEGVAMRGRASRESEAGGALEIINDEVDNARTLLKLAS